MQVDSRVHFTYFRDAWGYGAIDPSSGTAQQMELVRAFGKLKQSGWRPKRTIVFASWDPI